MSTAKLGGISPSTSSITTGMIFLFSFSANASSQWHSFDASDAGLMQNKNTSLFVTSASSRGFHSSLGSISAVSRNTFTSS
nr:hypothetical protein [Lentibacter algarum]